MAREVRTRRDERVSGLVLVAVLLTVMWASEVADTLPNVDLDQYGIEPREPDGLLGVVAAPFLHAGFGHLIANTAPFLLMGAVIALSGLRRIALVTLIVGAISGIGTWLVGGEDTLHLGASGLVFGFGTYLITRGIFSRNLIHLGVGAFVALTWGLALLGGLIPRYGVSWQAHLFGAIGGVLAARWLARRRAEPQQRSLLA